MKQKQTKHADAFAEYNRMRAIHDHQAYRGYQIDYWALRDDWTIKKDGYRIGYAASDIDARRQVDLLVK